MNSLIRILIVSSVLAMLPANLISQESDDNFFSDRLSLNLDIDPTTAFLNIGIDFSSRDRLVGDIIDYAKGYLGRPYSRGSKGPKAFDCSGFTSYVFKNFDIHLGASSSDQYLQGMGLDKTEVRPGDLVFFAGRGNKNRVGHVGMVVDVDERGVFTFIHASTTGGIRFDKYPDGGYYSQRYIGARRIID